jgi:hypothetical protein
MTMTHVVFTAAAMVASVTLASAQTTAPANDPHHPGAAGAAPAQTQPSPPARQRPMAGGAGQHGAMPMKPTGGPGGQGMMMGGDMAQMMTMMRMMHGGMGPMGMGPGGRQPFQHIEGQIAFFKAELKVTDAQAPQWNAFADALRGSAVRLREAMAKAAEARDSLPAPEQMERRLAMLTAQADATQAMLATAKPLYATLGDDQKKVADELMAEHMMTMRTRGL